MSPEELWLRYNPKLKNYIMKQVQDQYCAEDILQASFFIILRL